MRVSCARRILGGVNQCCVQPDSRTFVEPYNTAFERTIALAHPCTYSDPDSTTVKLTNTVADTEVRNLTRCFGWLTRCTLCCVFSL